MSTVKLIQITYTVNLMLTEKEMLDFYDTTDVSEVADKMYKEMTEGDVLLEDFEQFNSVNTLSVEAIEFK